MIGTKNKEVELRSATEMDWKNEEIDCLRNFKDIFFSKIQFPNLSCEKFLEFKKPGDVQIIHRSIQNSKNLNPF